MPAEVQKRIKAWAGHYGSATLRTLTLLQFRDHETLQELMADPELAPYLTPFKPHAKLGLAAVAQRDLSRVRALLADRGVTVSAES